MVGVRERANYVCIQQVSVAHVESRELFESRGQYLVLQLWQMRHDVLRAACLERRRDVAPKRNIWCKIGGEVVAEFKRHRPPFIAEEVEQLALQPWRQAVALEDEGVHLE